MAKTIELTLDYRENIEIALKKHDDKISDYRILSKSLDARNAPIGRSPKYHYKIEVIYLGEKFSLHQETFVDLGKLKQKPIIVGAGPAGLFCALRLLEYGVSSIIIERGERARARMISIAKYWKKGELNTESNVCFGEGGAGLFSDGKLITRIKSPYVDYIMNKLVEFGAPAEIAYYSNPHLGSNKIRNLIGEISDYLIERGCELYFNTKVSNTLIKDNQIEGVEISKGKKIYSNNVVFATGHSAKDSYDIVIKNKISLEAQDFSIGVRVEHPRKLFDQLQYGAFANDQILGASKYRLSHNNKSTQIGTYSFCMCPGGHVLSTGTEKNGIVTNGMSNSRRNSPWSNSAIVVQVKAGIHFKNSYQSSIDFQKKIEQSAYAFSKSFADGKQMPAQRLKDFSENRLSVNLPKTSCPSGIISCNLEEILPEYITDHLRNAFLSFNKKIKGFLTNDAILIAPETRTSSPVKIKRNIQTLESVTVLGLYPCGEGSGYAGGITSAAVDGVKCAMQILKKEKNYE